jgi:predicted TIM-barrel fold metal-dependent hydrolase
MLVDCHCHLSQFAHAGQTYAQIRDTLLQSMVDHGIQYSFVCPDSEPGSGVAELDVVQELTASCPGLRMYGTTSLPNAPSGVYAKLERLAAAGAIVGLKLYPGFEVFRPSEYACWPFYELCQEYALPVLFHSGESMGEVWREEYSAPEEIARVAEQFPSLNVIAAHFSQPHLERCLEALLRHPNLHADISGLAHPSVAAACGRDAIQVVLQRAVQEIPQQVLFGTDWPICDVEAHLELVRGLSVDDATKAMVLSSNAVRLFRLCATAGA